MKLKFQSPPMVTQTDTCERLHLLSTFSFTSGDFGRY